MSGLSVSLLFSWTSPHGHKMAAMALDMISKFTEGREKEGEREGSKYLHNLLWSGKQECFPMLPSCFAISLLLLVPHLPKLGHMAIPSCKDDWERWKQDYEDCSTPIMSHCMSHCNNIKLRKEGGRWIFGSISKFRSGIWALQDWELDTQAWGNGPSRER